MSESKNGGIQSVKRALDIIELLAESKEDLGVTQIAKKTGLCKTTAFRLLGTLVDEGYVQKKHSESAYGLSMKFLKISSSILERQNIRDIATPYMRTLSDKTEEIVHLAVMDVNEVVYIEKMESKERSIRIFSTVGKRSPMHCTGLGKAILSGLTDDEVERIVEQKGLTQYTENTISTIEDLKKELGQIRTQGCAFDQAEHELGIWCVAAPIYTRDGTCIAAISITTPEMLVSEEKKELLTREVINTARDISSQLGYM